MATHSFRDWFTQVTGHETGPRPWQEALGSRGECRSQLFRVATGEGKTEGVLAAWAFHRISSANDDWPRRLVWCLPMRVLVEQTAEVAKALVGQMPKAQRPEVSVLMGGESAAEWFLYPEKPAILIGTQDMLLSRALNRGYGAARARWPMEFGLLSHDALWVMDEVQLMDVGLATSAQLQAYRDQDSAKGLRPCHTWWMSATLQEEWLRSVDTAEQYPQWIKKPCKIALGQRKGGNWKTKKPLELESIDSNRAKEFANYALTAHAELSDGEHGRITLVVCNTVKRACDTYDAIREINEDQEVELVHGRFRPAEREDWRERFLSRAACTSGVDRIIVATQVVEAGVDISAGCLITELAPWPSLVQRFGRCARYGGDGRVIVVDRGRDDKSAPPYSVDQLESAWAALSRLKDVGIASLESYEESLDELDDTARTALYPYDPQHLVLRREFDELFDTTPDLTGADLDISRFIRSGEERDLQVFWLDIAKGERPTKERQPHQRELCAVPFLTARDWLCGEQTKSNPKPKMRSSMRAWIWDWLDGEWTDKISRTGLIPGRIVCVAAECGGYRDKRGFDQTAREPVTPRPPVDKIPAIVEAMDEADSQQSGDQLSINSWKTIACHSDEVREAIATIAAALHLPKELRKVFSLVSVWHDVGKAHPAFQGALRGKDRLDRQDLAKGPRTAWLRPPGTYRYADNSERRPGFRHELASLLALFAVLESYAPNHPALIGPWHELLSSIGQASEPTETSGAPPACVAPILDCSAETFDLLAYLVVSHHGKVRVALHAAPVDQEYKPRDDDERGLPIRGVREGDRLPTLRLGHDTDLLPELTLTLQPACLGLSNRTGASWRERTLGLLDRFGPAYLAYLEALFRAADVRASKLTTADPELLEVANR